MTAPTPYRDGAKRYRGLGLGQAIPVHPTENNQPLTGLIGYDAPRSGDTPAASEKRWRQAKPLQSDPKAERKARRQDQAFGSWNVGLHTDERVLALDVDDADEYRRGWAKRGLPAPPPTPYSTARGHASPRRQVVYRLPEGCDWDSDGLMPGGEIIDYGHRFIRVAPSIHQKTGNTYAWFFPTTADPLGDGREMESPPTFDELTELPAEHIAALRRGVEKRSRGKDDVDVDEWIASRPEGKMSQALRDIAYAVPTDGIGDNDAIRYLGPLVRAAWDAPGGGKAVERGIARYSDGYGRDAHKGAIRAVANAIIDETVIRERLTLTQVFDLAPRPPKRKKPKKRKKPGKNHAPLEHDEYEPRGVIGTTAHPARPLDVALDLLSEDTLPPLISWRGTWHVYERDHWRMATDDEVENLLYAALANAQWVQQTANGPKTQPWSPNQGRVREVLRAIRSRRTLHRDAEAPTWLDGSRKSAALVPCRDGLLEPRTGKMRGRSQHFFSTGYIDAEVGVRHAEPKAWHRFLEQLWDDDAESIALLQEWFGYLVAGDTRRHKGMLMIGPKRSGKGTILHIAEALVGGQQGAFAATMSSFSESFGLEMAEGRSLLTIGDLRGSGREAASAAQKLLEIIGGDSVYINRKGRAAISTVLRTRVMVATNSMPKLYDDAAVIDSRFLVLRLTRSFADREDLDLLDKLLPELGGIVQWALEGYRRLEKRDAFTVPASDAEDRAELRANSAPITEFISDACAATAGLGTPRVEVWKAYLNWCGNVGAAQMEQAHFNAAMAGAGYPPHRPREDGTRGAWRYRGLILQAEETATAKAERVWGRADDFVTSTT